MEEKLLITGICIMLLYLAGITLATNFKKKEKILFFGNHPVFQLIAYIMFFMTFLAIMKMVWLDR